MTIEVSAVGVSAPRLLTGREFLSLSGAFQSEMALSAADFDATEVLFSARPKAEKHTVYNFEVEGTHTYIAGGYRVHNRSTLSYWDPEQNGEITDIHLDAQGRLVVESISEDGGRWIITANTPAGSNTTSVTKEYTLGAEGETRFYLSQTETWVANGASGEVLTNIELDKNYWLYGDEIGGQLSAAVTPFILQAIGIDGAFERLAAGTLIDTLLQNLAEGGFNILHHSLLNASSNGQVVEQLAVDAFADFGIDLALNAIDGAVSLVSQLIMAEIFASSDLEGIPAAIMEGLVSAGIENVLTNGIDNLIDNIFGSDSALGIAYDPNHFDFSNAGSYVNLIFSVALNEIIPQPETIEGAIASSIAKVFAGSLQLAGLAGILVPALIGYIVGKIFDAIFDKDPEAFAGVKFDPVSGLFDIDYLNSDDGGSRPLAESLGKAFADRINEVQKALQSHSNNFAELETVRIGHFEDHLRNGDGTNYDMGDSAVILAAVVQAIEQMQSSDGDMKVARALHLGSVQQEIAGMSAEEAFTLLYSRMRIAADYQYYLEHTNEINTLLTIAPESPMAKAWLATILSAGEMGLADAYVVTGDGASNLFLTADGNDSVDGADGNDTIRTYSGVDTISGGQGDDLISGGAGADQIDGGAGTDTASFEESGAGVALDLGVGSGTAGDAQGDTYTSIENVTGSKLSDTITGSGSANSIAGGAGIDVLFGLGGADTLDGGAGGDIAFGGADNDLILGAEGNDILVGGTGADTLDGGAGTDLASYRDSSAAVQISLRTGARSGDAIGDVYLGLEGIEGSQFGDQLEAATSGSVLIGGQGNDTLTGSEVADNYLYALGDGSDTISDFDYQNNGGTDTFTFTNVNASQVSFRQNAGNDLVMTLSNGETVTIVDQFHGGLEWKVETISFADGSSLNVQGIRNKMVADMKASGAVLGSEWVENYHHALGDGSYAISDFDYQNNGGIDTFTFTNVNASQVTFRQNVGNDLVMTLSNGETVTIVDQFQDGQEVKVETINFADGSSLNLQGIRDKMVADMKASGAVLGSQQAENYRHALGDGSYTITDYDYFSNGGIDTFTFTNVNASQVTFRQNVGNDLVMTLSNGETVTIVDQFQDGQEVKVETINFADGSSLNLQGIRDKMVADMKASGAVLGSQQAENYRHALGDGSYTITDYDYFSNGGIDTFTFTNVNASQVTFRQNVGNDLVMTLSNGETVTIVDQFQDGQEVKVETINFADGSSLNLQGIRDKMVADMKASGAVLGSQQAENYRHALGDGSYTITDYDYFSNGGIDTFTFTNVNASQVTFRQNVGNDLVMTLSNGETVTIVDQFQDGQEVKVETINFADGSSLNLQGIRDKMVADMKASGAVLGSQQAENYRHALGDGSYTITDYDSFSNGGIDRLILSNAPRSDVLFERPSGSTNLLVRLSNGEVITIVGQFGTSNENGVEFVEFADGTTVTRASLSTLVVAGAAPLQSLLISGSASDDTLVGTVADDDFLSDLGADVFQGGGGNDTYFVSVSGGPATIVEASGQGSDRVEFLTNINPNLIYSEAIDVDQNGVLDLVVTLAGYTSPVVFRDVVQANGVTANSNLETVTFKGGATYTLQQFFDLTRASRGTGGNDSLVGTGNRDVFLATPGNDTIAAGNGSDVLQFGAGITLSSLAVTVANTTGNADLDLKISYAGGSVTIDGTHVDSANAPGRFMETIAFADGTVLTWQQFLNATINAGTSGNDLIAGTVSDDIFTASAGNDTMVAANGTDRLVFGAGITLSSLAVSVANTTGNADLDLKISYAGGSVTLDGTHADGWWAPAKYMETIAFADGTVLTWQQFLNATINVGTSGNDLITGTVSDDIFTASAGDDTMVAASGLDRLQLGSGITLSGLVVTAGNFTGNGEIDLKISYAGGSVTLDGTHADGWWAPAKYMETIAFADGTVLTWQQFLNATINVGTSGNDLITGTVSDDIFTASAGDDTMVAASGLDRLQLGSGITLSGLVVTAGNFTGNGEIDLKISYAGGSVTLDGTHADGWWAPAKYMETIAFADGTVLTWQQFLNATINVGTSGNDLITGTVSDDIFTASAGDDTMVAASGLDRLQLGSGITLSGLVVTAGNFTGNGEIDLKISYAGGSVTLDGTHADGWWAPAKYMETIAFADGTVLTWQQFLNATVNAGTPGNDLIYGTVSDDIFTASAGDDTMVAASGLDRLQLGSGITLSGLVVTAGNFTGNGEIDLKISYAGGSVTLDGTHADGWWAPAKYMETIAFADGTVLTWQQFLNATVNAGTPGNDLIYGSHLSDIFAASAGNDTLYGASGDDIYYVDKHGGKKRIYDSAGIDKIVFGNGVSVQDLRISETDVDGNGTKDMVFSFANGTGSVAIMDTSSASWSGSGKIEQFQFYDGTIVTRQFFQTGGTSSDTITGDAGNNLLYSLGGDDTLVGGGGADLLDGGDGNDLADYSTSGAAITIDLVTQVGLGGDAAGDTLSSIERVTGSGFNDSISADGNANVLDGGNGNDTLNGLSGDDTLKGMAGDDSLLGSLGNDLMIGGAGADTLDGGDGVDVASYESADGGVAVDLALGTGSVGDAAGDILIAIENLTGSNSSDSLSGDNSANLISGLNGYDLLEGRGGNDTLLGGYADDTLIGGAGADSLDGGDGAHDAASYQSNPTAVTIDLVTGNVSGGDAAGDTLVNLEDVIGSLFADTLSGNDSNNGLFGLDGDDTLSGGGGADLLDGEGGADNLVGGTGNDTLRGGIGYDTLTGGIGADQFNFVVGSGADTILDYNAAEDIIQFAGLIFANLTITQVGADVVIGYGTADVITVLNASATSFGETEFVFT